MSIKSKLAQSPTLLLGILVFHIGLLIYYLFTYSSEPFGWIWLQPLWALAFAVMWWYCCMLKKWAVYSYLFLVAVNIILRMVIQDPIMSSTTLNALFPLDILFSFFLLFFYKRFK